ncbi:hypothetical protein RJZ90_005569 [Blastomyces dermatitidis]
MVPLPTKARGTETLATKGRTIAYRDFRHPTHIHKKPITDEHVLPEKLDWTKENYARYIAQRLKVT